MTSVVPSVSLFHFFSFVVCFTSNQWHHEAECSAKDTASTCAAAAAAAGHQQNHVLLARAISCMQCDQTTHMSGHSFEHLKTTYQVLLLLLLLLLLLPPPSSRAEAAAKPSLAMLSLEIKCRQAV
jgi:hypothetical protein